MRAVVMVLAAALAAGTVWVPAALADEVQFINGDRLTGTIVSADGGKLKIKSAVAGTVEVNLSDVKTFRSDRPLDVVLKDGTQLRLPVAAADQPGQIALPTTAATEPATGPATAPAAGTVQGPPGRTVPVAAIRSINHKDGWAGTVVAGALISRGNSDTDAFNLSFDAARRTAVDRLNVSGQYLFGRQRDEDTGDKTTSTDNWRAAGKYDRFLSEKLYSFVSLGVEKDRIAGLDLRLTPAVGAGYQWVERPDFNVNTEAGVAYVYENYEDRASDENISLRLAYHVDRKVRDGVVVFHNTSFFPSVETVSDYYFLTDAGVRADLTDHFFTEFKVELKYDATPAPDASRSDLRYILGVGWSF